MPRIQIWRAGHPIREKKLEGYFDRRLKYTRTADAVDVADSTAQCAGNSSEITSKSSVWLAECGGIGHVEGIRTKLKSPLAEEGEALEERQIVRKVTWATELIALCIADGARNRISSCVRDASSRRTERSRIEPSGTRRSTDTMGYVIWSSLIDGLSRSRRCAGRGDLEGLT